MEDDLKKIVKPKTIKSKNNDCGTAPGNLVLQLLREGTIIKEWVTGIPN